MLTRPNTTTLFLMEDWANMSVSELQGALARSCTQQQSQDLWLQCQVAALSSRARISGCSAKPAATIELRLAAKPGTLAVVPSPQQLLCDGNCPYCAITVWSSNYHAIAYRVYIGGANSKQ